MILRATHTTTYSYADEVSIGYTEARLSPRGAPGHNLVAHELTIGPEPASALLHTDFFGNTVAAFSVQQPHRALKVTSQSIVQTRDFEPIHPASLRPGSRYAQRSTGMTAPTPSRHFSSSSNRRGRMPPRVRRVRKAVVSRGHTRARGRARPLQAHPRRFQVQHCRNHGDDPGRVMRCGRARVSAKTLRM